MTELGRALARLPVQPRLARLLIEGQRLRPAGARPPWRPPCWPSAIPSSPRRRPPPAHRRLRRAGPRRGAGGVRARRPHGGAEPRRGPFRAAGARPAAARACDRSEKARRAPTCADEETVLRALLAAFPDRRGPAARAGQPAWRHGRRPRRRPGPVQRRDRAGTVPVPSTWMPARAKRWCGKRRRCSATGCRPSVCVAIEVAFDEATRARRRPRRLRFDDLLMEERRRARRTATRRLACWSTAARRYRAGAAAGRFCGRLYLHAGALPAAMDARNWVCRPSTRPTCASCCRGLAAGCRSFAELRGPTGCGAMQGRLTHAQRQAVEREAPERLEVPSGSKHRAEIRSRPTAGAGGADSGIVRLDGNAANRRRPGAGAAALARPELPAAASDRRSGQFLGNDLSPGAEGSARTLSETCLAGRSRFGLAAAATGKAKSLTLSIAGHPAGCAFGIGRRATIPRPSPPGLAGERE